jgi:DNA adenine methylase
MRGVLLECMKDVDLIARYDNPETVFYCDPPYHATKHKANYANEYTEADHRKLAEVLHGIKGAAMISGYESDLYSELYGDWLCVKRKVKANRGAVREECLWLCPKAKGQITARLL